MAQQIPLNPSTGTLSTKDGDFNGLPAYTNFGAINMAGKFTNLQSAVFTNDRNITTSDNKSDFVNYGTVYNNQSLALIGAASFSSANKFDY